MTERKPYEISTVPDVVPACWAPFYRARGDIEAVHSMQRLHLTGKGESVSSISQIDIVRDYRVVPARNLGVAPGPMTCIALRPTVNRPLGNLAAERCFYIVDANAESE